MRHVSIFDCFFSLPPIINSDACNASITLNVQNLNNFAFKMKYAHFNECRMNKRSKNK